VDTQLAVSKELESHQTIVTSPETDSAETRA